MGEQSQILTLKGFLKNADSSWVYLLGMSHLGTIFVYEIVNHSYELFCQIFLPKLNIFPFFVEKV